MSSRSSIPQFDLYGDQTHYADPGFIHIEEIAERSSANGWKIKPHRHGKMLQILCMFSGRLSAAIDSETWSLEGSWALIIPAGTVHGYSFDPDTAGVVLTIADPYFSGQSINECERYFAAFRHQPHVFALDHENVLFRQLVQYSEMIKEELCAAEVGHELMLSWQVKMFLMTLRRQLDLSRLEVDTGQVSSQILMKFKQLLEQHFRDHWTVQQYADALHTSESTLNRLCNELLGCSTKTVIQNRMVTAIKRRLIFTKQPLDQVAYRLGYKDPSYFSRFFKQQTGQSPSVFRKEKADTM